MQKVIITVALLMLSALPAFADDPANFLNNYQLSADGSSAVAGTSITYNTQEGPVVVNNARKNDRATSETPGIRPKKADSKEQDSSSNKE